jgi:hypothetical protein
MARMEEKLCGSQFAPESFRLGMDRREVCCRLFCSWRSKAESGLQNLRITTSERKEHNEIRVGLWECMKGKTERGRLVV